MRFEYENGRNECIIIPLHVQNTKRQTYENGNVAKRRRKKFYDPAVEPLDSVRPWTGGNRDVLEVEEAREFSRRAACCRGFGLGLAAAFTAAGWDCMLAEGGVEAPSLLLAPEAGGAVPWSLPKNTALVLAPDTDKSNDCCACPVVPDPDACCPDAPSPNTETVTD